VQQHLGVPREVLRRSGAYPIDGCGRWFIGPWDLEWHTAAEHPGWTATYELLRPYPNQRQRVVYRRSAAPTSERPPPVHPPTSPPPTERGHDPGGGPCNP
jgi:hypothetical protein